MKRSIDKKKKEILQFGDQKIERTDLILGGTEEDKNKKKEKEKEETKDIDIVNMSFGWQD